MKVGVNDYVRTKDGTIDKVIVEYNGHCASPHCNCKHVNCERDYYDEDKIIKSSPNIIDLIEVGDYVDGLRVVDKDENYIVVETFDERIVITKEDTIKSIVTKEMYSSVEYRVESH